MCLLLAGCRGLNHDKHRTQNGLLKVLSSNRQGFGAVCRRDVVNISELFESWKRASLAYWGSNSPPEALSPGYKIELSKFFTHQELKYSIVCSADSVSGTTHFALGAVIYSNFSDLFSDLYFLEGELGGGIRICSAEKWFDYAEDECFNCLQKDLLNNLVATKRGMSLEDYYYNEGLSSGVLGGRTEVSAKFICDGNIHFGQGFADGLHLVYLTSSDSSTPFIREQSASIIKDIVFNKVIRYSQRSIIIPKLAVLPKS